MDIREQIEQLREVAKEIATSGHYGWPNSVNDAASTMEKMLAVVDVVRDINSCDDFWLRSDKLDEAVAALDDDNL